MGLRGPLPKGAEVRLLPASKRPGKLPAAPPAAAPAMPEGMPPLAVAAWRRLVPQLVASGTLTALDAPSLQSYCCNVARLAIVERELAALQARAVEEGRPEADALLQAGEKGLVRTSALVYLAMKLGNEIDRAAGLFGLHPVARVRLSPGKPAAPPAKSTDRFFSDPAA